MIPRSVSCYGLALAAAATLCWALWAGAAPAESRRSPAGGSRDYPPDMPGARAEVYKTVGDVKLNLHIFTPPGHKADDKRPAIVFFFGGGWTSGSPGQFLHQCQYLASRGMVAMAADYRVASRHQVKAVACVQDAKSAIRWVRAHAGALGIDPRRIAAGGGSAGGHIAACAGTLAGLDEPGEDAGVSSVPDALVLFNPALVLAPFSTNAHPKMRELLDSGRCGIEPEKISPYHHVRPGAPPAIVFHGKADTTVPYVTAEAFAKAMQRAGNRCELVGFEGQPHGFFNHGRGGNKFYTETLRQADRFLASLGWLKGEPSLQD